jgi:hypothetical protein
VDAGDRLRAVNQNLGYSRRKISLSSMHCVHRNKQTYSLAVNNIDDGGQLASIGAIVDQDNSADLNKSRESL